MKNFTLIIILSALSTTLTFAQEVTLKELSPFDKIVINGDVEKVQLIPADDESPVVKVIGAETGDVTAGVLAGTLNLSIEDNEPVTVMVYNSRLKRISGQEDLHITGAEVIGGTSGNYLVVSFDHGIGGAAWAWAGSGFNIHIPHADINIPDIPDIPEINVDIPELDFDFDFEHWNNEWKHNWEDHQEELRLWNKELSEEMKDAMEEAREEMKKAREEMEEAREELQKLSED